MSFDSPHNFITSMTLYYTVS